MGERDLLRDQFTRDIGKSMKPSILIVDDDDVMQETLSDVLKKRGYEIFSVGSGNGALSVIKKNIIDLILLDMKLPDVDGLEVLKKIKEFDTEILVIMMTAVSDVQTAVSAMKSGAYDYINKPFELDELKLLIEKGLETKSLINEVRRLHRQQKEEFQNSHIHGVSPQIQYVKELIGMISKTHKTSVLIQGESGTGKELAANAIHYNSKRGNKPLMKINCSAIPDSLLESELFGYEKGAFTDAKNTKKGLFELADGGTVFLDEIGDMKPFLQSKILRVLANIFIQENNREYNKNIKGFSEEAKKMVIQYTWPGNVRELKNVIERAMILTEQEVITQKHLPFELKQTEKVIHRNTEHEISEITPDLSLENMEKMHLSKVLKRLEWNKSKASKSLGISRATLRAKIKRYNLSEN